MNDDSRADGLHAVFGNAVLPFGVRARFARWAPMPLRLIVGYGFIAHGYAKIARGPDVFVGVVHALGVPAPYLTGWAAIILELVCGLAVLTGALVPLASVPMVAILLVAMFTVHLPYGFTSIKLVAVTGDGPQFGPPGYECDLLYLACLAALLLTGPGPCSIDGLRERLRRLRQMPDVPAPAVRPGESTRDSGAAKVQALVIAASLPGAAFAPAGTADAQVTYRYIEVDHVYISYGEPNRSDAPTSPLLQGPPSPSRSFEPRFAHLVVPDYFRTGHRDGPDTSVLGGTVDGIATGRWRFTEEVRIAHCELYTRDCGGSPGSRAASPHPERVQAFLMQDPVADDAGPRPAWERRRAPGAARRVDETVLRERVVSWTTACSESGCYERRVLLTFERRVPMRSLHVARNGSPGIVPWAAIPVELREPAGKAE